MTLKEAVLKSLEDINRITTYSEVYNHIILQNYYDFSSQQRPMATVSSTLGDFIRHGDTRVKRIKHNGGTYSYYLSKNEQNIGIDILAESLDEKPVKKTDKLKSYDERDLHKLLSSYLKSTGIFCKTIFHEQSTFGKDSNQIWTHPDMVGIRFLKLQTTTGQHFLKAFNRVDTFKLSSYEIKKEINSDSDLKKAFFQAVSNSNWANYGYLVAFEINPSLTEELERLNQSFGIGVIELNAKPFQSRVLFSARYRDLDYRTMDKLCLINPEFSTFIEQIEKLLTAEERYIKAIEREMEEFCDVYFENDTEIEDYCKEKHIPQDNRE